MRRSGVLAGVFAFGSTSLLQASLVWPDEPARCRGQREHDGDRHEREPGEQHAADPSPAALGRRTGGGEEADGEARQQQDGHQQHQQRPELVPGVDARGHRRAVLGQAVLGERPQHDRRRSERGADQRRHGAQAQRHRGEPDHQAHSERDQRPARVGEHHAHEHDAEQRPGQGVDDVGARAPRRQPQQRRHAERRHQPDAVPVLERSAQAGIELVGGQGAGEHLGQQRPRAHGDRAARDAVEQLGPAPGSEPHERDRAGERRQIGERAVGLQPRVGRRQRPQDGE